MVEQGTVNQEFPITKKKEVPPLRHLLTVLGQYQRSLGTAPKKSWDSAVWGQSWDSAVLGQSWTRAVLVQSWDTTALRQYSLGTARSWDTSLGTVVLGQWSWDSGLGTMVLGH